MLRLERVRLKYNVLDGVWSEDIFWREIVIMMFLKVVVNDKKILSM